MSEDRTRALPDSRSFEERLFARLDAMDERFAAMEARFEARFRAIDARFDTVDERLDSLDNRVKALEAKALDTNPIWENALAEILAVKRGVGEVMNRMESIERKFDVLALDMMRLRGDQRGLGKRMDALESRPQ